MTRRGLFLLAGVALVAGAQPASVVRVQARRFEFVPDTIRLKAGEPVTLEVTSTDELHGFAIPALKLRADLPPGETWRTTFVPDRTGRFAMVCDNFCGEGHDDMSGVVIVQ